MYTGADPNYNFFFKLLYQNKKKIGTFYIANCEIIYHCRVNANKNVVSVLLIHFVRGTFYRFSYFIETLKSGTGCNIPGLSVLVVSFQE